MQILRGRVRPGIGDYGQWVTQHQAVYQRYTGMVLYPGSLNVELDAPWSLPSDRIHVSAAEVGRGVNLVPCHVFDRPAFIMRTDANEAGTGAHPKTIVEIVTDVRLRDAFHLEDGDPVRLTV
jgi:CTP-dependent riboflavin kinase